MIQIIEQDNYQVALDLAKKAWAELDPYVQAQRCGCHTAAASAGGSVAVEVTYLNLSCVVTHPEGVITVRGLQSPLPLWEQILILHYLTSTGPVPTATEPIVFSQVPSGVFYDKAFQGRVKNHFLSVFGRRPDLLIPAASCLGGEAYPGHGDVAVRIRAFPKVELYFVLWKQDEEFPADMNLLMSSNISSFLSTEDIAVLSGLAAGKLIKHAKILSG